MCVALLPKRPSGCIRLSASTPGDGLLFRSQLRNRCLATGACCEVLDHENEIIVRSMRTIGEYAQLYTGHTK